MRSVSLEEAEATPVGRRPGGITGTPHVGRRVLYARSGGASRETEEGCRRKGRGRCRRHGAVGRSQRLREVFEKAGFGHFREAPRTPRSSIANGPPVWIMIGRPLMVMPAPSTVAEDHPVEAYYRNYF